MAMMESILFTPHTPVVEAGAISWAENVAEKTLDGLPQIFWADCTPWNEANLWLLERARDEQVDIKTVISNARSLSAYAKWLEESDVDWKAFPEARRKRCLVQYRGALIQARSEARLAPSTVSARMRVATQFYRWLKRKNLINPASPLWRERKVSISFGSTIGLERTLSVLTTDLSIPNRKVSTSQLEDGLLPVSNADRKAILDFIFAEGTEEILLMTTCAFCTGMRVGTISDLRIETLLNAVPDPYANGLFTLAVGPGACPPVATKFGVTGQVWIPGDLLTRLLEYAKSPRRLRREALAAPEEKDVLFLTRSGNPYARRGADKSPAINVEMYKLRKLALKFHQHPISEFKIHRGRCTFATNLAKLALPIIGGVATIGLVKQALLQRDEKSALSYIRFIESEPIKEEVANIFTRDFLGIISSR